MQFRCLLAGVALVLSGASLAACDSGDDSATTLTNPPTTTAHSTTTTTPTTSTTLDFETEVKLAALELIELRNEVLMAPDPERVSEYLSELCECLERERQILADLAATGRRWRTRVVEPLGLRLDRSDEGNPTFTLIARQPPGIIDGPDGEESIAEVEFAPYFLSLVPDSRGEWRLNGLQGIPAMQVEVAEAIVEEQGLP